MLPHDPPASDTRLLPPSPPHTPAPPLPPLQAPDKATYIEIEFEKGDPVKLDGQALSPAAMLTALNKVAGDNGIGRVDIVESRFVGGLSGGWLVRRWAVSV